MRIFYWLTVHVRPARIVSQLKIQRASIFLKEFFIPLNSLLAKRAFTPPLRIRRLLAGAAPSV